MTVELWVLVYAAFLGLIQLVAATVAPMSQPGYAQWVKTNRDAPFVATGKAGALKRAFDNFKETFVFFVVAVIAVTFGHKSSGLSVWGAHIYLFARIAYVPAYLLAIPPARTLIWSASMVGMGMCFWSLFI